MTSIATKFTSSKKKLLCWLHSNLMFFFRLFFDVEDSEVFLKEINSIICIGIYTVNQPRHVNSTRYHHWDFIGWCMQTPNDLHLATRFYVSNDVTDGVKTILWLLIILFVKWRQTNRILLPGCLLILRVFYNLYSYTSSY